MGILSTSLVAVLASYMAHIIVYSIAQLGFQISVLLRHRANDIVSTPGEVSGVQWTLTNPDLSPCLDC